jgi:hypothetical protein
MNLFQILATDMCSNTLVSTVIGIVKTIFTIIQIAIPIALIVFCTIDMFKAITSGDEKKTKEAWKTAGRRLIYAIIAFLIPWLISLVFSFVGSVVNDQEAQNELSNFQTFFACWKSGSTSGSTTKTGECHRYDSNGNLYVDEGATSEEVCDAVNGFWSKN